MYSLGLYKTDLVMYTQLFLEPDPLMRGRKFPHNLFITPRDSQLQQWLLWFFMQISSNGHFTAANLHPYCESDSARGVAKCPGGQRQDYDHLN